MLDLYPSWQRGSNGGPMIRDAGWYATHRDMLNHPIVGICQPVKPDDPKRGSASRFEAWHWLIANAAYTECEWNNKGRRQTINAGQLVAGRAFLAHVWNWSEKTVRVFLSQLLREHMITLATDQIRGQQRANTTNIITLCNYLRYQLSDEERKEPEGPAKGQQGASEGPAKGHISNKDTNIQIPPLPPMLGGDDAKPDFETFWQAFPGGRKRGKGKARELFQKIVSGQHRKLRAKPETLIEAAERYAATKPDPDYVPMPQTWLNSGRWEDDLAESQPGSPAKPWWTDPAKVSAVTDSQWRGSIARYANGIWPVDKLGPPPGSKRCMVPEHIIAELGLAEKYDANGLSREAH